jgi:hypothetical protein
LRRVSLAFVLSGYSSSAAARRIRAARCVVRFPEVYGLLKANEVNVSTVAQVSRILNVQNKDVLLSRIRGTSQREVDAIVAEYQPHLVLRDVIRPVVVRVPAVPAESSEPSKTPGAGKTEERGDAPATDCDAIRPAAGSR